MFDDPALATFIDTDAFRSEFAPRPLADLAAMEKLAPYRDRMVAAGLTQPERVATRQALLLAAELLLDVTAAEQVRNVARTVVSVPISVARFDIAQVLLNHEVPEMSAALFDDVKDDIRTCVGRLRLTDGERKAVRESLDSFAVWRTGNGC